MAKSLAELVVADGVRRGRETVNIPANKLVIREELDGRSFDPPQAAMDRLKRLIVAHSQKVAVLIEIGPKGEPFVTDGRRRVRAIREINPGQLVRCEIDRGASGVGKDSLSTSFMLNDARSNPTVADRLMFAKQLHDEGVSNSEIAEQVDRSESWVSQALSVATLPSEMLGELHDGRLRFAAAYRLSMETPARRRKVLSDLARINKEITPDNIDQMIATWGEQQEQREPEKEKPAQDSQPSRRGVTTTKGRAKPLGSQQEPEAEKPAPKKKGRPKGSLNRNPTQRSIKSALLIFLVDQATDDPDDVWKELCHNLVLFSKGEIKAQDMVTIGKQACGMK